MAQSRGGKSPANFTHQLKGIQFPASKRDLVRHAESNDAEEEVLGVIRDMPDEAFESMADVMKGVGKVE